MCGRPLGMRFDKDGYLIVADAYLGLYKINVATGNDLLSIIQISLRHILDITQNVAGHLYVYV